MPEGYYKRVPYPNRQEHWLDQAAAENQLIICRCQSCKKLVRYIAADLLPILGPAWRASLDPPFPCSCGEREWISVKCETPSVGDYGHLLVRRPAGIKQTQTWKTVRLGDEIKNEVMALPDRSDFIAIMSGKKPRPRGQKGED